MFVRLAYFKLPQNSEQLVGITKNVCFHQAISSQFMLFFPSIVLLFVHVCGFMPVQSMTVLPYFSSVCLAFFY